MKKYILTILVTAIVFTGIGAFAAIKYQADEIGYNNTTVKDAIDILYTTQNTTVSTQASTISNLQEQISSLQPLRNMPPVLYIYADTNKTSSWSSKDLGYGFYQTNNDYIEQVFENNLYFSRAKKPCKIRVSIIMWNGTGAPTNTPQIRLYKNDTIVDTLSISKTSGDFNSKAVTLTLNTGDKISYSTYGGGNVYTCYLVYMQYIPE